MTVEEIYTAIEDGDTDSLTEWLNELEVSPSILRFLDSLCIYAVKYNQLDVLKLLSEYAANLEVPWTSSYLLEYAIQLDRRAMIEYLKTRVDTDRDISTL